MTYTRNLDWNIPKCFIKVMVWPISAWFQLTAERWCWCRAIMGVPGGAVSSNETSPIILLLFRPQCNLIGIYLPTTIFIAEMKCLQNILVILYGRIPGGGNNFATCIAAEIIKRCRFQFRYLFIFNLCWIKHEINNSVLHETSITYGVWKLYQFWFSVYLPGFCIQAIFANENTTQNFDKTFLATRKYACEEIQHLKKHYSGSIYTV